MTNLINSTLSAYNHALYDLADRRSDSWFLMDSPWPIAAMVIFYMYFVKVLGPRFMKNRPAYNLNSIVIAYNFIQICACTHLVYRSIFAGFGSRHPLKCYGIDFSNTPQGIEEAAIFYYYTMLKLSDLLDTVFFVFKKKYNQISFLHVYHHAFMAFATWMYAKYAPGGQADIVVFLNSFVHIWMYLYYFLTSISEKYKKNIWWKKYITQMQMVQFCIIFVHLLPVYFRKDCKYPVKWCIPMTFQSIAFFTLFYNFYRKAYLKKKTV